MVHLVRHHHHTIATAVRAGPNLWQPSESCDLIHEICYACQIELDLKLPPAQTDRHDAQFRGGGGQIRRWLFLDHSVSASVWVICVSLFWL